MADDIPNSGAPLTATGAYGTPAIGAPAAQEDTGNDVSRQTSAAIRMNRFDMMLRALLHGTDAMRQAGEKFLPLWPNEEKDAWSFRLSLATLFPAYQRTVAILAARPFSRPLTFSEDMPAIVKETWALDIDKHGTHLQDFAKRLLESAMGYGFAGILVDSPEANAVTPRASGVASKAEQDAAGIRPYFVMIEACSIIGWRHKIENGMFKLTQLRLKELVQEPQGAFGELDVQQIRVLEPGTWETYRKNEKGDWISHKKGTTTLDYIPFVPVYGTYLGWMRSAPPLLNLAYMNIEHWQSKSDQQNILHTARVPILTMIGGDDKTQITIGGKSAVVVPQGGDLKYTEHSGKSIEAGAKSLDTLEEQMRQAGGELLRPAIRTGVITATQIWSENEAGMSVLQCIAINLQYSLNQALDYMADLAGEDDSGDVTVFLDFDVQGAADTTGPYLLQLNQAGKISDETLFKENQRRGLLAADLTWEDEQTEIANQPPPLGTLTDPNLPPDPNAPPVDHNAPPKGKGNLNA